MDWRHPSACISSATPDTCPPPPPMPPLPPPPPPPPPPIECAGLQTCLPSWKPTWHMKNSTVLYTCNNTGMHNVTHANQFGVVVYDWSNAKAIWANAHPMSSEELITKQAEMVYEQDPGVPGYAPRVWAYRNTIKALNWYGQRAPPQTPGIQLTREDLMMGGVTGGATPPLVHGGESVVPHL